jgi:hypothetical protein
MMDVSLRNVDGNSDVDALPDGVYRVQEASDEKLIYDIRVNDHHQWQYHRENGMTKMGIVSSAKNLSTGVITAMTGQVEAASIVNKAYIKQLFNTTVITGMNFYPYEFDINYIIGKLSNEEAAVMLPFCLCLGMPVFMYTIVLEKE